ncbi:MAG: C-terminal binding protein [Planctomycetes bacterium]|nr:C-terminal binding protein [Planctomycetota bacterium]
MAKYKVLIADSRYPDYQEERGVLEPIGAEVIVNRSDDEDEVAEAIMGCDGFIVNLAPAVSAKVIAAMDKCKCVSRYGVGYDTVDTEALKAKGVYLANVPDYCEEDVSDQAFALFMDCVRKTARKDRHVRQGEWNLAGIQKIYRIAGKTFGFVGYGMIARCVHRKLSGFNLGRVLAFDPFYPPEKAKAAGVELVNLETLCKESDYISVHAPLLPQTRKMISTAQFDQMKATAIIINTSRGPLIDEDALVEALKANKIACAGLDVFTEEPLPLDSELRKQDNLTISDHAGWYSEESMIELKTKAALNIADTLVDGKPRYAVNI